MAVDPIPADYPRVTPYFVVDRASDAIRFYTEVLGGEERMRMPGPDGKIGHAEIAFGREMIMLADEFPDMGALSPKTVGGTPVMVMLYVEDVDATFAEALAAGAKELEPITDKFYGDRSGSFEDPFGHRWTIASHVEDVPPDEMEKRAAQAMSEMGG
jgi:PhnB protein